MLDCEALFQSIRRDMVHGARRYGAGATYDAIRNSIETFRECQKDLASYLAIELDFAFSKLSARNAVEQCDALLFDPGTTAKVRWYCLYLKARLLIDVIPYTENEALRFEALSLAETNGFRVLAAVTKVNWVLAALSKADAHTASLKLNEARSAVANLSHQELEDPDAFGIKARLKAHEAKVLIHVVEETESPPANTVELVNNIYNEVCKNIESFDHLRANYRTELADEMLRLAKKGIPGAIEAAEAALEAAHTSFDAHHCNLCRGYFYEITAEYHLLVAAAATDWSTTEAIAELNKAKQAAAESVNYFTIAEHPSAKLARNLLEKSRVRMHALNKPTQIFLSHKGKNKDLVRRFKSALVSVRYRPWLDEDALKAGANLERGLLQGMKESCAAVFFITQDFVDNGYLATEIEYAIGRERESGSDFRIITLVFKDDDGAIGEVPPLLKRFVWKHPQNELEAFTIIVEALPLDLPVPRWRSED